MLISECDKKNTKTLNFEIYKEVQHNREKPLADVKETLKINIMNEKYIYSDCSERIIVFYYYHANLFWTGNMPVNLINLINLNIFNILLFVTLIHFFLDVQLV